MADSNKRTDRFMTARKARPTQAGLKSIDTAYAGGPLYFEPEKARFKCKYRGSPDAADTTHENGPSSRWVPKRTVVSESIEFVGSFLMRLVR